MKISFTSTIKASKILVIDYTVCNYLMPFEKAYIGCFTSSYMGPFAFVTKFHNLLEFSVKEVTENI